MPRPFVALLIVSCLFVGVIGAFWLRQPPSNQELLANYAKAKDYANIAMTLRDWPWWTPNYLYGSSLAFLSFGALTNASVLLAAKLGGPYLGAKLAALVFLFLCPWTMYAFVRRLCPASAWPAVCCGALYLFAPPILLRLGHVEHAGNVLAFAMLPLAFRGVLVFFETRTVLSGFLCAAANALLVLSYAKIAVLTLPLLAVFALWVWIARTHFTRPSWPAMLACLGLFCLLAVLPNLPALRESGFAAKFDFGPFEGWQAAYSDRSIVSWMDRDALLTRKPSSPQSEVRTDSSYLGVVGLACVAGLFFLRRRPAWLTPEGNVFRLFIALTLIAHWFALGVNSALTGHLAFLSLADIAADPAIAISWALLILQGIVIYWILPGSLLLRPWLAGAAIAVYFCVPGFRLLEKIPLYAEIRAPHDFFEMGGVFCFCVAAGMAAFLLIREIPSRAIRGLAAAAALGTAAVDSAGTVPSFFKGPLDRRTFDDFLAATEFLAKAASPGRVEPISGRYFYLLIPLLSGRGITTEAYNSHLLLRGMARLQQAAWASPDALRTFFSITGTRFLFIDKKDPDTPKQLQDAVRPQGSPVFENEHFLVLENAQALSPAFFGRQFIRLDAPDQEIAGQALRAAQKNLIAISDAVPEDDSGQVEDENNLPTQPAPFTRLKEADFRRPTAEQIVLSPPAETGWLLVPESFHPDWRALQGARPLEMAKAFCGLMAVRTTGSPSPVTLSFRPPAWYPACCWISLAAWAGLGIVVLGSRLSFLPAGWKASLTTVFPPTAPVPSFPEQDSHDLPAGKILVVIPTYNEAEAISGVLDDTLKSESGIEILVVDDASPDGTADLVRRHPAFGQRLHLLERNRKLGLGSAYQAGFEWALSRNFAACIEMDADLSHNPADISRLIAALREGADAAIGSRYLEGVRVLNWPQDRLMLSLGASKFVRTLTGLPLTDATSGFKAIRCDALRRLDWNRFKAEGYGFQVELHYFLWKSGARLVEVPIVFTERREGSTKMTPGIAFEALRRVIGLAIKGK